MWIFFGRYHHNYVIYDKMARTQTHRTTQKHVDHKDATNIYNKTIFCVFSDVTLCFFYVLATIDSFQL